MTREIFFFKHDAEKKSGRLIPDLFLFFVKALYKVKASGQHLSFNIFCSTRLGHTIKTNNIKFHTVDLEKGLGLVYPPHLMMMMMIMNCFCDMVY